MAFQIFCPLAHLTPAVCEHHPLNPCLLIRSSVDHVKVPATLCRTQPHLSCPRLSTPLHSSPSHVVWKSSPSHTAPHPDSPSRAKPRPAGLIQSPRHAQPNPAPPVHSRPRPSLPGLSSPCRAIPRPAGLIQSPRPAAPNLSMPNQTRPHLSSPVPARRRLACPVLAEPRPRKNHPFGSVAPNGWFRNQACTRCRSHLAIHTSRSALLQLLPHCQ